MLCSIESHGTELDDEGDSQLEELEHMREGNDINKEEAASTPQTSKTPRV